MTDEARSCRVQVLVDGHAVADCECLNCDVEVERGGQGERRAGRPLRGRARVAPPRHPQGARLRERPRGAVGAGRWSR